MRKRNVGRLVVALLFCGMSGQSHAALIARWKFDEAAGPTAFDSAGSANGTLLGGAAFAPSSGIAGGAIRLQKSTNDIVTMGANFPMTTGSFSIQSWIKTTSVGDMSALLPVSRHASGSTNGYFLAINDVGDSSPSPINKAHFYDSSPSNSSTTAVNDGQWHQLVGVYDVANGNTKLYVDGALEATETLTGIGGNGASFLVGGLVNTSNNPAGVFDGWIDEVRVYDHALTTTEVLATFNNPTSTSVPEPSGLFALAIGLIGGFFRRCKADLRKKKRYADSFRLPYLSTRE